jgi:hypothetical protein
MYIDPSGESFSDWWGRNWKTVVTIVAAVGTGILIAASFGTATPLLAAAWAGAGAGFVGGTLGTALNGGSLVESLTAGFKGALTGDVFGVAGAYIAGAIGAIGIIPGALSGAGTSVGLGIISNVLNGEDWDNNIALNATLGSIGGGISRASAAKASGSGIWLGTPAPRVPASVVSSLTPAGLSTQNSGPTADAKLPSTTQTSTKPTTQAQTAVALPRDGGYVDVSKTELGRVVLENTSNNNKTLNINIKSGHTPMDVYNEMLTLQGMDKINLPSTSGSYHSFTNPACIKYSIYYGGVSNPNGFTVQANLPNGGIHFLKLR